MTRVVWFCTAWLAGIALASQYALPMWAWLSLAGLALALAIILRAQPRARGPLALIVALSLGAARYQSAQPVFNEQALATYNDQGEVVLEGVVWDEPDQRDVRVNLRVRVETLQLAGASAPINVEGLALVAAPRFSEARLAQTGEAEFRYGDRVRITGQLETPAEFEDFSYRDYLARFGIYSQVRQAPVAFLAEQQGEPLWQMIFDFKRGALLTLARLFPEPHAALLQGILLGVDSGIPQDIKDQFSLTGTSHIVAISG